MATRVGRIVAGVSIILIGLFVIAGSRPGEPNEPSIFLSFIGMVMLATLLTWGLVSAVREVEEGIRHNSVSAGSVLTLVTLGSVFLFMAIVLLLVVLFRSGYIGFPSFTD